MNNISTKRFNLRKIKLEDSENVFIILNDKETVKFLNLPSINTEEDARKLIANYLIDLEKGNKFPFAICKKDSDEFIGVFLIKLDLYDEDCFEFTIYINKKFWNQGVYSEILPYMVEFVFEEIKTGNFRGFVMKNNKISARVLIKNSFILEKEFKVEGLTEIIQSYLMTKEDYYNKIKKRRKKEMYLKRLELQGFKSFADKTILEFKPGITSVIGPNGSGKSNISDSIRWVLGEQSMKSLRGTKSEDIIFSGTQNRKSLGFAEASIVIDNSDGKLPIEYSEVTVTRKIFRSGETGYFINKVPCRLKDVLELFMDTGIGKDGYSIIGQGKIDEILSNKSEDRRHIFEEATGIVRYRTRKQESEKKLEQTKLNLLRINDIISEIESNIEPLRIQSEKAKQFLNLREELKNIEVGLFIFRIEEYREKLKKLTEDIEIMNSQKDVEQEKLEALQKNKEDLKIAVDNITIQIEELQNIGFESSNKIEKINSNINLAKEKIVHNNENVERLESERQEVENRIKELEEEISGKKEKQKNLLINKEKFEKELEEKEEKLKEITSKMSGKELEIEQKKKEVEKLIDEKYEKSGLITAIDTNSQNSEKRKQTLKTENMQIVSELDSKRSDKQEISKTFYEMESKRNSLLKEKNEEELKKQEASRVQEEFEIKINEIANQIRIKDSKRKFLIETEKEKDGYIKSVKSLLIACEKDNLLNKGVNRSFG